MEQTEVTEMLRQLTNVIGGLNTQISGMSKSMTALDKSSKVLRGAQYEFANEMTATAKKIKESNPLISTDSGNSKKTKQEVTNNAFLDQAKMSKDIARMKEIAEATFVKLGAPLPKSIEQQQAQKLDAILKGQEVIAGHLHDNPYLRKIEEMHTALGKQREAMRDKSIAGKMEKWGSGSSNPFAKMIGGIGGTINSVRSAKNTVGDVGSFLFGGGIGARRAEKKIEKDRRSNERDQPLLNAYASRQQEINNALKSKSLPADERKKLTEELNQVKGLHSVVKDRVENRNAEMSKNTFTSLSYNEKRLNPKQHKSYSKEEKSYLSSHLQSNIDKSFIRQKDVVAEATGQNGTFGNILDNKKSKNALVSGHANNKVGNLRKNIEARMKDGAKSTDPIIRNLQKQLFNETKNKNKNKSDKPLTAVKTFGTKITDSKTGKKNQGKNDLFTQAVTGNIDKPTTIPEHIASMSSSLRTISKHSKSLGQNNSEGMMPKSGSGGSGGFGLAGIAAMVAGVAIAGIGQKIMKSIGIGDGSAGGSVKDDIAMKGGRALLNTGAKKTATSLGKQATIAGAKQAFKKGGAKAAGKIGAKAVGKSLVKKIPFVGAGMGLVFGAQRAMKGDMLGAGGEVLSGALSLIPGFGTAASVLVDAALVARDVSKSAKKDQDADKKNSVNTSSDKQSNRSSKVELSSANVNKKYDDTKQNEVYAKQVAKAIGEDNLNGSGRNVARRDAGLTAKALGTEITG